MTVDVVILSFCKNQGFFDLNTNCISSLISSERNISFNIVVIESNPEWQSLGLTYNFVNVSVIQPKEIFNYNRFLNLGLASTKSDLLVFSNNDVIFNQGWLSEILKVKAKQPTIRSFCPFDRTSPYLRWEKYNRKEFHYGYRVPINFVGWCFVIERDVFKTTGCFDESFDLYFQDNDFANTLKKYKIPHAMVPASFVRHLGGYTTKVTDASKTEKYQLDKARYILKWGTESIFRKFLRKLSSLSRIEIPKI